MPAVPAPIRGTPLILHVEDSRAQRDALKSVLEANGFSVLQASSTEEALQLCRDTPVSLVIADHMFGGSGGSGLAGLIKQMNPTVPVVLHSGNAPATMQYLDGFIHKGQPTSALVSFLQDLINRYWE